MSAVLTSRRDFFGGIICLLIGCATVYGGVHYRVGTLANMGPGFFPTAVGVLLIPVGLAIALGARFARENSGEARRPDWRGWACIIGGILAFAILGVYGGLVPASFAVVFISALGDRNNSVLQAAMLAGAMDVVAVVVFSWALQLQLPLFSWG